MIDKIITFLDIYCEGVKESAKIIGKYKTISRTLLFLIKEKVFTTDELRKELSLYIERIISENEFNQILDSNRVEYALIFCE